ncbi:MAG: hypothetical protein LBG25_03680 [Spirochaetaceae bacterium]|jgi:hypothetical protein|nr:hypothetical protein [Spirochaetaceae bacterium]
MFKKSRFTRSAVGAAASTVALILIAFLALLGCPLSTGSSKTPQIEPEPEPTPAQEAKDLADSLGNGATYNPETATTTVTADKTVSAAVSVQSGVTLSVTPGKTLTLSGPNAKLNVATGGKVAVPASAEVNVAANAKVEVAGDLTVAGDLNVAANAKVEVKSGGVFFLDGGGGTLAGTITIKPGAKTYSTGTFTGIGWTVIEAGGEAYAYQTPNTGTPVATIGGTDAVFNLTSGTFALNAGGYVLDGAVTQMLGTPESENLMFGLTVPLTIEAGGVLTIPAAESSTPTRILILWLDEFLLTGKPADGGKDAAKIVVNGQLAFAKTGVTWPSDPSSSITNLNFYETIGTKITSNWQTSKTFNWSATAGGSSPDIAGWVKQP